MAQKTKPCPFCGCKPYIGKSAWGPGFVVNCPNTKCPMQAVCSNHKKSRKVARAAWNTRV